MYKIPTSKEFRRRRSLDRIYGHLLFNYGYEFKFSAINRRTMRSKFDFVSDQALMNQINVLMNKGFLNIDEQGYCKLQPGEEYLEINKPTLSSLLNINEEGIINIYAFLATTNENSTKKRIAQEALNLVYDIAAGKLVVGLVEKLVKVGLVEKQDNEYTAGPAASNTLLKSNDPNTHKLYFITDKRTDKLIYIGITGDIDKRHEQHFVQQAEPNKPLYRHMQTEGSEHFKMEIKAEHHSREFILEMEKQLIQHTPGLLNVVHNT